MTQAPLRVGLDGGAQTVSGVRMVPDVAPQVRIQPEVSISNQPIANMDLNVGALMSA